MWSVHGAANPQNKLPRGLCNYEKMIAQQC